MAFNLGSIFGSSSQSEASTTTSQTYDIQTGGWAVRDLQDNANFSANTLVGQRNVSQAAGAISSPIEVTGDNNKITATDYGSVSKALELAFKGVDAANQLGTTALTQASALTSGIFDAQATQTKQLASALESIKTTDKQTLVIGALAIVATLAAFVYRKG